MLQFLGLARVPGDALVDADQIVRRAPQVDALEQPLDVKVLWLGRLVHRLVVDGEVVDDVLALAVAVRAGAFAVHALHAVAQDVGDLVGERRVIGHDGRVGGRQNRGVAVHVLQPLAGQGGAPGGRADQETTAHLVGGRPDGVPGALEAEHRVEDVQRDHGLAVGGVAAAGGDEAAHGTGLGDALVEDLAVLGLPVAQHEVVVHRSVVLPVGVVDLQRREPGIQAEGARLVRDDRHHALGHGLVAHEVAHDAHQRHGGGDLLLAGALQGAAHGLHLGHGERLEALATLRQETTELLAAIQHVLDLRGVRAGVVVRRQLGVLLQRLVADGDVLLGAELFQVLEAEALHLVGGVAALEVVAQAVALNRVREDDGRLVLRLHRAGVGGVDLAVVVAATGQRPDLLVAHVLDELLGAGVAIEEVLADVGAVVGLEGLVVAVRGVVHDVHERAVLVLFEQLVPLAAPDDLDDVPAGTAEEALQLLDDLRVAADRPVEALEVAVHDEGEVVQVVQRGHLDGAAGLWLIHLAVAEERPDVLFGGVFQPAVVQVAVEPCLVYRVDRTQPHGDGGEFPELGHAVRVRVGGQPNVWLGGLLAEAVQLLFTESALEVSTGVHAGGCVALEEDVVAAAGVVLASEEVVQPDLVEGCGGGVGGDVPTHTDAGALGAVHHHRRVPAGPAAIALLHLLITRELWLHGGGDGVDVVGGGQRRQGNALGGGALEEAEHEVAAAVRSSTVEQPVEGVHPLLGFLRVAVDEVGRHPVADVAEVGVLPGAGCATVLGV